MKALLFFITEINSRFYTRSNQYRPLPLECILYILLILLMLFLQHDGDIFILESESSKQRDVVWKKLCVVCDILNVIIFF